MTQPAPTPWHRTITATQWRTLLAAKLGWMLDAMDFLLFIMALGRLKTYFGFDDSVAGLLGTVTLLTSAAGGLMFGVIADRVGRTRALTATVLIFSICLLGADSSAGLCQLMVWCVYLGFVVVG